ncbi:hypothetical protein C2S52_004342 [Perilla frutescens var. hirtella]|nr:hypothetical protein C2S51_011233 [Perilla frutescens var. frutescens]KAH6793865.1 hypothetical protein C2S52_004342 [Perilla frutescens var. hirtella]
MSSYGFSTSSEGSATAIALCRADRTLDQCRDCVRTAAHQLADLCQNRTQGALWGYYCMLRFSMGETTDQTHDSSSSSSSTFILRSYENVSEGNEYFREDVTRLLADLRVKAANGTSDLKAGEGTRTTTTRSTIYGMAQCTPDLSSEECRKCLADITDEMLRVFDMAAGARMLAPNCIIRYELYSFYNRTRLRELRMLQPPPSPPPPPRKDDGKRDVAVVITVTIGVCLLALPACALIYLRKRLMMIKGTSSSHHEVTQTIDEINTVESLSLQYDLGQITTATCDFANANKLGQGGFGTVYRGKLPDGEEIAVKRLSKNSGQGNAEFKNEVVLVAGLQHRNLVRLKGFSLEGTERLLVYELVENGSLDHFIFDPIKRARLDWDTRHKIIWGVARGLLYLHEDSRLRIIHRDLKASNVLLDGDMNAKIADFGMARLSRHDEIQGNTTRIVGTYGYMSPEYAMHGQFSIKSDVFSFGVLILEIISGKRNNCILCGENVEDLLTLTWEKWQRGVAEDMIDPLLHLHNSRNFLSKMVRCIHIGLLCVQENAAYRPTMSSVLHMLNTSASTLSVPTEPAFYMTSRFGPIQEYDSGAGLLEPSSRNHMSLTTALYPR